MGRFSVKQTSDGRYMFNLVANNNRVISSSQTYASVANAKIGIESVRTNCAAPVEDQTVRATRSSNIQSTRSTSMLAASLGSGSRRRTAR